jgi:hypothetical protein
MVGPSLAYTEFERAVEFERTKRRRMAAGLLCIIGGMWLYFSVALIQARHETRKATGEIRVEAAR